jgi:ABC-2 type transport system permease protein
VNQNVSSRPVGFLEHLRLLWGLRLTIGLNRGEGKSRALAVLAFVASSAPSVVVGWSFFQLMQVKAIATSRHWPDFLLNLLCFVTTCVWVTWPVMSAGVDDHSELSRYSAFPISPFRLMLASTLASLVEPRAIVFYAPITGAALGYAHIRPVHWPAMAVALYVTFALFNAALARVGLHVVLNVLRQRRSVELIGGFFVVMLIGASFIPPIDTRWLTQLGGGIEVVPDALIQDAAIALARFPTGWFGAGLHVLWAGRTFRAFELLTQMVMFTMIAMTVAYGLLLHFHRHTGRGGPTEGETREANPFRRTQGTFATLLLREAVDLWHNPRARLLATVPFVLSILLKVLSGRDLFAYLLGRTADAWVMGSLCLYSAVVIASTFSQNTFAYDGHGFTVFLAAPVELGRVLLAKNLVHAAGAFAIASLEAAFYVTYFGHGTGYDVAAALLGVSVLVPVLLAAGNFLSLYFPVKFHADLARRDKLPFAASMLGVGAAALGAAPFSAALKLRGEDGVDLSTLALLGASAAGTFMVYRLTLGPAMRLLVLRRERVLRAVTRE